MPAGGAFSVDVRVRTLAEQERVDAALRALPPYLDGATVTIGGGPNRPPLEAASSAALLDRAQALAAGLGLPALTTAGVGGASDGNFTAGVGTPTLDGLGAVGGGAHADDEHVLVEHLPGRTALLARAGRRPARAPPVPARDPARDLREGPTMTLPDDVGTHRSAHPATT